MRPQDLLRAGQPKIVNDKGRYHSLGKDSGRSSPPGQKSACEKLERRFGACHRLRTDDGLSSINFVNAAGLRPEDSAFVGLSNFPPLDRNHAVKERTHTRYGFF